MSRLFIIALVAIVLAFVGIQVGLMMRSEPVSIIQVNQPTPELQRAIDKARAALPDFVVRLQTPKATDKAFAIQTRVIGVNGQAEHIWINNLKFKDGRFSGTLAEQPLLLPGKRKGMPINVRERDISDWAILHADGTKEGNFAEATLAGRR